MTSENFRFVSELQVRSRIEKCEHFVFSDYKHIDDIRSVIKSLIIFSSIGGSTNIKKEEDGNSNSLNVSDHSVPSSVDAFTCNTARVGEPISYSRALCVLAYYLLLEQDGLRMSPQDVFFLIFALSGSTVPNDAPYKSYFSLHPNKSHKGRQTFADSIPEVIKDSIYLRSAIETLHPKKSALIKTAGFHFEEFFYSAFTNLFAGLLPTQSLFRLWDLLFCVVVAPPHLIDSDVTYLEIQRQAGHVAQPPRNSKRVLFGGICCGGEPSSSFEQKVGSSDDDSAIAIRRFFGTSTGRRVLLTFSFSVMSQVLEELPLDATAKEIRDSIIARLISLRDPSEVVLMVEKGDFYLFSSTVNQRHIDALCTAYIESKTDQLEVHKYQNKLLQDIIYPVFEEQGHVVPSQVAVAFNKKYTGPHDLFTAVPVGPGMATADLKNIMYPMLKYQALYAPHVLLSLPLGIMGRILIKIDEFEVFNKVLNVRPVIRVKFSGEQQQIESEDFMTSPRFIFNRDNLFYFNISTPPPYTFDVSLLTDSGKLIAKVKDGVKIQKLLSQGSTFK